MVVDRWSVLTKLTIDIELNSSLDRFYFKSSLFYWILSDSDNALINISFTTLLTSSLSPILST